MGQFMLRKCCQVLVHKLQSVAILHADVSERDMFTAVCVQMMTGLYFMGMSG